MPVNFDANYRSSSLRQRVLTDIQNYPDPRQISTISSAEPEGAK